MVDGIGYYLKMKSKPKYYNDEVVKSGYARGEETVNYVKDILERYEQYKRLIDLRANDKRIPKMDF